MAIEVFEFRAAFDRRLGITASRMAEFSRNVGFELARNIIVGGEVSPGTPVRHGYARNSWIVSLGGLPSGYRHPSRNPNPESEVSVVSLDEAMTALLDMKADDVVYISSNCEYMQFLESGSSSQAPEGMVALTVSGARQIVASIAAQMRASG